MDRSSASRACGLIALIIAVVTLLGWALHSPALIKLVPGRAGMVLNTALGVLLAGLLLLVPISVSWRTQARRIGGALLVALGTVVLFENLLNVDFGLDWPSLHEWAFLNSTITNPGRVAPNTCVAFMLAGLAFALSTFRARILQAAARMLALTVLAAGLTGLIGQFLKLDLLFELTNVTRMAFAASVSMMVLGAGLWLELRDARQVSERQDEENQILPIAISALIGVALIASASVFTFMQGRIEHIRGEQLLRMHGDRSQFFLAAVDETSDETTSLARSRPNLLARMRKLHASPGDTASIENLNDIARGVLAQGFSWVAFYQHGRLVASAGRRITNAELEVALSGSDTRRTLLWKDAYHLRMQVSMRDKEGYLGDVMTEQPLFALTRLAADTNHWGQTGEMVVCARNNDDSTMFRCFPERFHEHAFTVPTTVQGQLVPMALATKGLTGITSSNDFRAERVLAAYGPLGDLGLGLVLKMDWSEIYAPVREQLSIMLPTLALVIVISTAFLRRRIRPLIARMIEAQREALQNQRRFQAVADTAPDAIVSANGKGRITYLNNTAERLFGYRSEEAVGHSLTILMPEKFRPMHQQGFARFLATGEANVVGKTVELVGLRKDGTEFPIELALAHWMVDDAHFFTAIIRDITDRKLFEDRLRFMAQNDALTALPNRALFLDRMEQAIRRGRRNDKPMALLYLDIDHFKHINDTLGHAMGDKLLQAFGARLRACVRPTDTVARLAGDEFTVILEDLQSPDNAQLIALKIIGAMQVPMWLDDQEIMVTTSIGIAPYTGEELTVSQLMERADKALYEAKHAGRNYFAVYQAARAPFTSTKN